MPEENNSQQFKRNIAYKLRIGDLLVAKPIFDQDKFLFLELGDKKISRVNVIGNIVDKYESEGEKKYIFFTLDDGSGQIKVRAFGDDVARFKAIEQGQTVAVIGTMRNFNNENYILPEIIKEQDPKYLLIRKLEIEKTRNTQTPATSQATPEARQQAVAIKDQILEKIKSAEQDGGIETEKIILEIRETTPEIINQEIKKLLEEGIIFEPRPGKVRYLG